MKNATIAPSTLLHFGGTLPPGHGIGLQALFHGLACLLPMLRQALGVFNGHAGALCQRLQRRVRRISQQGDAALGPAAQGLTIGVRRAAETPSEVLRTADVMLPDPAATGPVLRALARRLEEEEPATGRRRAET